jgi:predicted acylesterase/phospholipase RssA
MIGLALSGGGSRAAAFHRGTLQGLAEIEFLGDVDVVSTVSGGSLFGAAWVHSVATGEALETFLGRMEKELREGFVARSLLSWHSLRIPFPGFTRTELMARRFDEIFFEGMTLGELPERPALCLNATVLNTGQVGRLGRDGFETRARRPPRKHPVPLPTLPMPGFPLSRAVAASAAFPIGLAPVPLRFGSDLPDEWRRGTELEGLRALELTDGGVIDNLGVQALLGAGRFGRWDFVVSDAGSRPGLWQPTLLEGARSAFMGTLSAGTLKAVSTLMSDKCDRLLRRQTFGALESSWLAGSAAGDAGDGAPALGSYLGESYPSPPAPSPLRRRRILMVRVDQSWHDFLLGIPAWRLVELGAPATDARRWIARREAAAVEAFLRSLPAVSPGLTRAKGIFEEPAGLAGEAGVARANGVATNFTALAPRDLMALAGQARWQVHALHSVFW